MMYGAGAFDIALSGSPSLCKVGQVNVVIQVSLTHHTYVDGFE